jgi:aryl-alcohol dehydrogenase-like predicted oxidoreductase
LDAGINFMDTSYGYGLSEEYIGRCISYCRREYYLATKCGCTIAKGRAHDKTPHRWTRDNLLHNLETSLRRLQAEYIDIWQLHNPSVQQVEAEVLVRVMEEVRTGGKVGWIGISSTLPHMNMFLEWGVFDAFQIPYSALERAHEEVITAVAQAWAGTIIRGGVARGAPEEGGLGGQRYWLSDSNREILTVKAC